jgi:SAM-dependent methyltransferase
MTDAGSLLPELYDLDSEGFDLDVSFYEQLAASVGGDVLELGVGTGRAAVRLAAAGLAVWGIDTSADMLARARRRAGERGGRLHFVEADMRDFELGRRFGLVYAGYGAFHHLLTPDDQLACLRCAARHLAPGGILTFDLRPWHWASWEEGDSVPLLHEWTASLPGTGETVIKLSAVRADREQQVQHELHLYDIIAEDGSVRRIARNVDLRFSTEDELRERLQLAGLSLEHAYGGYDRAPYNEASEYLIIVARHAEEA